VRALQQAQTQESVQEDGHCERTVPEKTSLHEEAHVHWALDCATTGMEGQHKRETVGVIKMMSRSEPAQQVEMCKMVCMKGLFEMHIRERAGMWARASAWDRVSGCGQVGTRDGQCVGGWVQASMRWNSRVHGQK
jgi:hypothetical protein